MMRAALFLTLLLLAVPASAQFKGTRQPDVRYVPSPDSVVDAKLNREAADNAKRAGASGYAGSVVDRSFFCRASTRS